MKVDYMNGTTREWTGIMLNNATIAERSVYAATTQERTVTYLDYGGGAYFITGIDGQEQDGTNSWLYAVNGVYPGKGANAYELHSGDNIFWNFTSDPFG